ncbi:Peroxisome assembly protein, partial [Globisporangium splendens]
MSSSVLPHVKAAQAALAECQQPRQSLETPPPQPRLQYARLGDPRVGLRVNKWDALILDSEILGLLKTPMKSMFSMFEPGVMDRVKPEIDALLGALLFAFSTGIKRFEQSALTPKRIGALFLLSVGVPYAWKRVFRYISSSRWTSPPRDESSESSDNEDGEARRTRLLNLMKWLETFVISCQFANLLVFLRKGTYRSLPERCLGMKMESIAPSTTPRSINFEYMTRQLLWDGLMEFGNFVLPFLTWSRSRATSRLRGDDADTAGNRSQCTLCGITPPQTAVAGDDDFA